MLYSVVNNLIILEIKAAEGLRDENKAQLINYLKATKKEISEIETSNPCISA